MSAGTKYVFVTGGVISSLGKGITAASLACLLKSRGVKVNVLKCDPYLNINPGLLSPMQHGEVFVTCDGMETDLDLGHYERFMDQETNRDNTVTAGRVYETVLNAEKSGKFAGKTIQVVPHITNEIKYRFKKAAENYEVLIVEIGGTVGDIEGLPFLEAARQFRNDVGRDNVLHIHVTLVPYIKASDEMKTKPTQHSVMKLRELGIEPSIIVCRMEQPLTDELKDKISLFCSVEKRAVIEENDVQNSIYEVPVKLYEEKLDELVIEYLSLKVKPADLKQWNEMLFTCINPKHSVTIAIAGKYTELKDSYKSIYEALKHGGFANDSAVKIKYVDLDSANLIKELSEADAIIAPDGAVEPGALEKKMEVIKYARENNVPFFGICLGMQCAVVEFARNVCNMKDADSQEFNIQAKNPVIVKSIAKNADGSEWRLGSWHCSVKKGSKAFEAYKTDSVSERHRHRFEFNNAFLQTFEKTGLIVSGVNPEMKFAEIVELGNHPWFIGVQFNPEFQSRPVRPHPLFKGFIGAALKRKETKPDV